MFQLDKDESAALRSQIATSNTGRGGRRYAPYVFTEQRGAVIEKRLERIERGMGEHDEQFEQIFSALRQLIAPPPQEKRPIGFGVRS
jgi:ORF6N domain-containing protein